MKECVNKKDNLLKCSCTYEPCSRKGICCECLHYHRQHNELPACFFPKDIERTYDRSLKRFLSIYK
ncbi:MAG: DUF6485 family protein [Candidatus Omnitrophica bacterium]|nr:DUF6485 family protein [Candidatus Omnitrophota bacterium]